MSINHATTDVVSGEGGTHNLAVSDARGLLQRRRDVRDIYWQEGVLHIKVIQATEQVRTDIETLLSTKLKHVPIQFESVIPVAAPQSAKPTEMMDVLDTAADIPTVDPT